MDVGESQPHLLCHLHLRATSVTPRSAKNVAEKPPLRPNAFILHWRHLPRPRDKWRGHLSFESWTSAQVQCQAPPAFSSNTSRYKMPYNPICLSHGVIKMSNSHMELKQMCTLTLLSANAAPYQANLSPVCSLYCIPHSMPSLNQKIKKKLSS